MFDGKPYDQIGLLQKVARLQRREPAVDWVAWAERERADLTARAAVAAGGMVGVLAAQSKYSAPHH